jgi:hypothetical protein
MPNEDPFLPTIIRIQDANEALIRLKLAIETWPKFEHVRQSTFTFELIQRLRFSASELERVLRLKHEKTYPESIVQPTPVPEPPDKMPEPERGLICPHCHKEIKDIFTTYAFGRPDPARRAVLNEIDKTP